VTSLVPQFALIVAAGLIVAGVLLAFGAAAALIVAGVELALMALYVEVDDAEAD
jgi:hypothetical protein